MRLAIYRIQSRDSRPWVASIALSAAASKQARANGSDRLLADYSCQRCDETINTAKARAQIKTRVPLLSNPSRSYRENKERGNVVGTTWQVGRSTEARSCIGVGSWMQCGETAGLAIGVMVIERTAKRGARQCPSNDAGIPVSRRICRSASCNSEAETAYRGDEWSSTMAVVVLLQSIILYV